VTENASRFRTSAADIHERALELQDYFCARRHRASGARGRSARASRVSSGASANWSRGCSDESWSFSWERGGSTHVCGGLSWELAVRTMFRSLVPAFLVASTLLACEARAPNQEGSQRCRRVSAISASPLPLYRRLGRSLRASTAARTLLPSACAPRRTRATLQGRSRSAPDPCRRGSEAPGDPS
jgi:hypothetical protein